MTYHVIPAALATDTTAIGKALLTGYIGIYYSTGENIAMCHTLVSYMHTCSIM